MKITIRVRNSGENEVVGSVDTDKAPAAMAELFLQIFDLLDEGKIVMVEKEKETVKECS